MEVQQETLFTAEATASRLRSSIPGSVVEVNADDDNLCVSAVFDARDYWNAYSRIRSVLFNGLDSDKLPEVHLSWAPNKRAWELGVIRDAVINALPLRLANGSDLSHKVTLSTNGFTLRIHVCTAGLFNLMTMSRTDCRQIEEAWFRKVASLEMRLPKGITNVSVQIGDPEVNWLPAPFASVDGDDGDGNPNWPSRTGNPSGKGRGNNPPRR